MSERQYWINKYNFSRRMVDHRYPYDFFKSINQPKWTLENFFAARTHLIGG
jgi:hypothetical protein